MVIMTMTLTIHFRVYAHQGANRHARGNVAALLVIGHIRTFCPLSKTMTLLGRTYIGPDQRPILCLNGQIVRYKSFVADETKPRILQWDDKIILGEPEYYGFEIIGGALAGHYEISGFTVSERRSGRLLIDATGSRCGR
jgi:hypothetical protein